ncbi:MAG TPA: alpha/beta hydrolase [Candidatus Limnocylindrales bacterium]|nr:alpha/beta hydrolase [Candidatus Limnocylindrales bacterium]
MGTTVLEPARAEAAMSARVEHVATRDGTQLLLRHWPVPNGQPWAAMLTVHGLAEHCGRYEHVGAQLARGGLDVHGFDLRGFGGSGGARASIDRWSQHHDDLEERLSAVRSIAPARPLVLFGHSLGGLIALGYVLDGRARPDLLVLSAPAIGAKIPLWQRVLVASLRRVAPGLSLSNRLDPDDLSCVASVGEDYVADPLNQHKSTVRFAHAAFGEQRRVAASLDRLSIPTLVVHGADDRIVPTDASAPLQGRPGVTRKVYPGLRHELHNEVPGRQVVADELDWIRDRVSRIHTPPAS